VLIDPRNPSDIRIGVSCAGLLPRLRRHRRISKASADRCESWPLLPTSGRISLPGMLFKLKSAPRLTHPIAERREVVVGAMSRRWRSPRAGSRYIAVVSERQARSQPRAPDRQPRNITCGKFGGHIGDLEEAIDRHPTEPITLDDRRQSSFGDVMSAWSPDGPLCRPQCRV